MKKEEKVLTIGEMITPGVQKVLIELLRENTEYAPGIQRLNVQIEPYQLVHAVGESVSWIKPGDYIITRNMPYEAFKLYGKEYCIIYNTDVSAVISKEIAKEIKAQLSKEKEEVN